MAPGVLNRPFMTAAEIAALVQGELVGRADLKVCSGQTLERAGPNQLAFWQRKHETDSLPATDAGCILVDQKTLAEEHTLIRVGQPRRAFARAIRTIIGAERFEAGIDPSASVNSSAELGERVTVGPLAVVEGGAFIGDGCVIGPHAFVGRGAVLGRECRLHPGARVFGNARLGDRVLLHSGAVIGSDGFGLVFEDDHYEKFPQVGGVEIGDDVEIGVNSCVDRGALDDTRIGTGTKLDNLVHIGHNCQIGRHVVMAAQVGLSGGVIVEDYAVLGGQVGIGDRARVGAQVQLGGQGGLLPDKQLEAGGSYWGTPARPLKEQLVRQALTNRLPELFKELKRLRARVEELEGS